MSAPDAPKAGRSHPYRVEPVRSRLFADRTWETWVTGIATYERRTPDGRCAIHEASSWRTTYVARVDGEYLTSATGKRTAFRSEDAAARAAIAKVEAAQ